MFFLLFAIVLLAYALAICHTADKIVTVQGTITNPYSEPVSGATVMFISSEDTISTTSDGSGLYSVQLKVLETNVDDNDQPQKFTLHQNYPNPFNPVTTISYDLIKQARVTLDIYSITGQLVRRLKDGYDLAGSYRIYWDGRDDAGKSVAAGVYLYRLKADGFEQSRKMILLDGNGGGVYRSQIYVNHEKTAKIAGDPLKCYTIIVEKAGYIAEKESDVCFSEESDQSLTKNFTLIWKPVSTTETERYSLISDKESLNSYPDGGGLFIISMTPKDSFEGEIHLAIEADSLLHAQLTKVSLSRENPITEVDIRPEAIVSIGGLHLILVFSSYDSAIDTLQFVVGIIEPFPDLEIFKKIKKTIETKMDDFFIWLEINHQEFGIKTGQEWFAYDLCPGCTGGFTWKFLNSIWDINFSGGTFSPHNYTIVLRRRNTVETVLVARKEDDESEIYEMPLTK